jgi:hypothetical protein
LRCIQVNTDDHTEALDIAEMSFDADGAFMAVVK